MDHTKRIEIQQRARELSERILGRTDYFAAKQIEDALMEFAEKSNDDE